MTCQQNTIFIIGFQVYMQVRTPLSQRLRMLKFEEIGCALSFDPHLIYFEIFNDFFLLFFFL